MRHCEVQHTASACHCLPGQSYFAILFTRTKNYTEGFWQHNAMLSQSFDPHTHTIPTGTDTYLHTYSYTRAQKTQTPARTDTGANHRAQVQTQHQMLEFGVLMNTNFQSLYPETQRNRPMTAQASCFYNQQEFFHVERSKHTHTNL